MDKEAAPAPAPPPAAESEEGVSSTKDEDRASSIEAAIAEFDRARLELSGLLGRELGGAEASKAPAAGAAAPAAPEPARSQESAPSKPTSRAAPRDDKAAAEKKSDNGCVNVCRALDSLTRSAAAVCRLDEGDRCKKANSVVSSAQGDPSVKACGCKR